MCNPITQEDLDLMQTINIKDIIQFYKYLIIVSGIGIYLLFIFPIKPRFITY